MAIFNTCAININDVFLFVVHLYTPLTDKTKYIIIGSKATVVRLEAKLWHVLPNRLRASSGRRLCSSAEQKNDKEWRNSGKSRVVEYLVISIQEERLSSHQMIFPHTSDDSSGLSCYKSRARAAPSWNANGGLIT